MNTTNPKNNSNSNNDYLPILEEIKQLKLEKDEFEKEKRGLKHEFEQITNELKLENEKLTKTNTSLEALFLTIKKPVSKSEELIEKEAIIHEKDKRFSELESKYLLVEQALQDLKRQNQKLNMENTGMKFEIEKLQINNVNNNPKSSMFARQESGVVNFSRFQSRSSVANVKFARQESGLVKFTKQESVSIKENSSNSDELELTLEEAKTLLSDFMNENEELKKEKTEIGEKALQMLADKEVEKIELQEKLNKVVEQYRNESNKFINEIQEYKEKILDFESKDEDENNSINSNDNEELKERQQEEANNYYKLKQEYDDSLKNWEKEKENFKLQLENSEMTYKSTIDSLEDHISRLKMELNNIEREINHDSQSKGYFVSQNEKLEEKIKQLEESKLELEQKYKEKIKDLKLIMNDLEKQNIQLKEKINKNEKELNIYKENKEKRLKDIEEYKVKLSQKEKEIVTLKNKLFNIDRQNEILKKDYEESNKSAIKQNVDYKDVLEKIKLINQDHNSELKKFEDKVSITEKKLESEKILVIMLTEKLKKCGINTDISSNSTNYTNISDRKNSDIGLSSLSDLESSENDFKFEAENINLRNEIVLLNNRLNELSSNKNTTRITAELEVLKKENVSLKQNIVEIQEMYENQIKDLQQKGLNVNAEFQSLRRLTSKITAKGDMESLFKHVQFENQLETKIKELSAEIKFLNDKIDIQNLEMKVQKKLKESDVNFLKEELKRSDTLAVNAKVQLAQIVFEKDDEIMQLKTLNKKFKTKLITLKGGLNSGMTIVK